MENKIDKKKIVYGVLGIILVIAIVGASYAYFSITIEGKKTQVIQSGELSLSIKDENQITLVDAYPIPDSQGLETDKEYTFTLSNDGNADLSYGIKLIDDLVAQGTCPADLNSGNACKFIPSQYIRYQVTKEKEPPAIGGLKASNEFATGIIKGNQKINYRLKIWLSEDTPNEYQNSFYLGKLEITGTQTGGFVYSDSSGAASPELMDGLIPVIWNGTDWVSVGLSDKWYDYENQWWANAVTTTATNRVNYQTPGTVIPMNDINTMWVWVPRYEYKFSNMANQYAGGTAELPGAIGINFISENVTTPSDAANYKVHPAFTFGDQELSGIWVGKFETSSQTSCKAVTNVANSACDLTTLGVQIKPNVSSWRGIRASTAFMASREMSNSGNVYGLNNATTDSHMMKNTEWGAVAYLSQSIYGKYGSSAFTDANKEIYINNDNNFLTGCSGGAANVAKLACKYTYEKSNSGTGASTTGNIYGIYDMNGGAFEYVMGNMKAEENREQQSGKSNSNNSNSGFTGINYDKTQVSGISYPEAKYYDSYNYSISKSDVLNRYIKGDATYETSKWYGDESIFVYNDAPWFFRGDREQNQTGSGIFSFRNYFGSAFDAATYRLILVSII